VNRDSHTFTKANFFENEKFVRGKKSQWRVVLGEEGVTYLFGVIAWRIETIENGLSRRLDGISLLSSGNQ